MDFKSVTPGDHIQNPCSPVMEKDVAGIRINVPPEVRLSEDLFLVCGTYYFPAEYVYSFKSIHEAIVLVVVDAFSHRPWCCNLVVPGVIKGAEESHVPPKDPEWMKNHFIERYFNINLFSYMEDLPRTASTYYVYALIENHASNVCKVVCSE